MLPNDLSFFLNLSGVLVSLLVVLHIVLNYSGVATLLERPVRIGLVLAGIPWIALTVWDFTGSDRALWLIPVLFAAAVFFKFFPVLSRWPANWRLKREGGWRCRSCGKENEKIAPVCYFCQTWREPDQKPKL